MGTTNAVLRLGKVPAAALAAVSLFALPAFAADLKISKSAFAYGGTRYYRGKAENVRLGSYGEKKTPVGQTNYLAVQNHITQANLAKVKVGIAGPFPMEWSKYSKTDVEAGLSTKYVKAGGATATLSHEAAKSANLKLVKFYLNEGELRKLLNNHADGARNYLADEGNDGRVVSEVWVVMEGTLASQVTTSGSVSGSGTANGLQIDVKASTSSTTTTKITLPPDTTFAYMMHKVKKWEDKKTRVGDLEDDQHGMF